MSRCGTPPWPTVRTVQTYTISSAGRIDADKPSRVVAILHGQPSTAFVWRMRLAALRGHAIAGFGCQARRPPARHVMHIPPQPALQPSPPNSHRFRRQPNRSFGIRMNVTRRQWIAAGLSGRQIGLQAADFRKYCGLRGFDQHHHVEKNLAVTCLPVGRHKWADAGAVAVSGFLNITLIRHRSNSALWLKELANLAVCSASGRDSAPSYRLQDWPRRRVAAAPRLLH